MQPPDLPAWLAPALPFRRVLVEVDGVRLHAIDHGDGPAVVLFHGNPSWCFLWRKVIARLPGYRVIAPDLWGLGLSDKPRRPSDHRLDRHVALMSGLLDALDVHDAVLVGQDWGGPVAAGVGCEAPGRVAGLVFGNTAVVPPRRPLKIKGFHRFAHRPIVSDLVFRVGGFPLGWMGKTQGDPSSIGRFERRAYRWPLRRIRDRAAPLGLARMVPDREDHPTTPLVDRYGAWVVGFEGPVALVWGTRDPILGRGLGRHRELLPRATVTETTAGHFLQEEVPDDLAKAILQVRG